MLLFVCLPLIAVASGGCNDEAVLLQASVAQPVGDADAAAPATATAKSDAQKALQEAGNVSAAADNHSAAALEHARNATEGALKAVASRNITAHEAAGRFAAVDTAGDEKVAAAQEKSQDVDATNTHTRNAQDARAIEAKEADVKNTCSRTSGEPKVHLFAFGGGPAYTKRIENFRTEALATSFFDEVHTLSKLPDKITSDERWKLHLQERRGGGYWFWKSVLMLDLFNTSMAYGDVLVYLDAGTLLGNLSGWDALLGELCRHDIITYNIGCSEPMWTKGDIFKRFGVGYEQAPYGTEPQMAGGAIIMRKTVRSELFLKHWIDLASDFQLISDNPSQAANSPSFKENRHDQSLLSMLVKANSPEFAFSPDSINLTFPLHKEFGIAGLNPIVMQSAPEYLKPDFPFGFVRCRDNLWCTQVHDVPSCGSCTACRTLKQSLNNCVPTMVHPP